MKFLLDAPIPCTQDKHLHHHNPRGGMARSGSWNGGTLEPKGLRDELERTKNTTSSPNLEEKLVSQKESSILEVGEVANDVRSFLQQKHSPGGESR